MEQRELMAERVRAHDNGVARPDREDEAHAHEHVDQTSVLPPFDAADNPDPVDELENQLRKTSFFVQASLEKHGKLAQRLDAYLTGLLDVLIETGVVDAERLGEVVNQNRALQAEEEAQKVAENGGLNAWPTILVRDERPDDPQEPTTPVDCAARLHICKAICCSLRFPLGPSEIEAGVVKFEVGHPYVVRHSEQGYCVHNDRATGRCGVYDDRPQVCRAYSCADDNRIWADFDRMILNEEFLQSRQPTRFHFTPDQKGGVPVQFARRSDGRTVLAETMNGEAGR